MAGVYTAASETVIGIVEEVRVKVVNDGVEVVSEELVEEGVHQEEVKEIVRKVREVVLALGRCWRSWTISRRPVCDFFFLSGPHFDTNAFSEYAPCGALSIQLLLFT